MWRTRKKHLRAQVKVLSTYLQNKKKQEEEKLEQVQNKKKQGEQKLKCRVQMCRTRKNKEYKS